MPRTIAQAKRANPFSIMEDVAKRLDTCEPRETSDAHSKIRLHVDEHGIPVLYDSGVRKKGKPAPKPDAVSVLSHELLSPLTLIKGYATTLLELDGAITSDQKRKYLRGIDSAANRVVRLIENLRDIDELEHGDGVTFEPTNLPRLLQNIISEVQDRTTTHVLRFGFRGTLPLVETDPPKIEQVITNLLVNAIKYSPQGGDIETEISLVRKESDLDGIKTPPFRLAVPCVVISVSDAGIGIPEQELLNIFQCFYRVDNRHTRVTPGAGLGLYICKAIVEAHHGSIWARNRSSGGAIFSFSLPVSH